MCPPYLGAALRKVAHEDLPVVGVVQAAPLEERTVLDLVGDRAPGAAPEEGAVEVINFPPLFH